MQDDLLLALDRLLVLGVPPQLKVDDGYLVLELGKAGPRAGQQISNVSNVSVRYKKGMMTQTKG